MADKKSTRGTTKWLAFVILLLPAAVVVFVGTRDCSHQFEILDDFGEGYNYEFIDAKGKTHSYKEFSDQVVLITTLQPTCPGECAISLWHLNHLIFQKVRKNKKKLGSVRIISFITDGDGNAIEDLSSINDMLEDQIEGYDPEVWYLASGDQSKVFDFEHNGESLMKKGDEYFGGEAYKELMLLMDRKNHLRMVLSGKTEGMIRRMREHVALLQKQYDKELADENSI